MIRSAFNSEAYAPITALRDAGRAAEYNSSTSWQQEMTAKIKIKDGKLTLESVDWADLEPGH